MIQRIIERLIRPRWITPSELTSITLQITQKPNPIFFYYSFKIIPSLKTSLNMPTSIDVKFPSSFARFLASSGD